LGRGPIAIPKEPVLISELEAFEATKTPSGLIRYAAPEGMHDDTVMALALAWHGAQRPKMQSAKVDFYARTAPAAAPPRAARSNEEIERMLDG